MEDLIREMLQNAELHKDYDMADFAYKLMEELVRTINAPSNWRDFPEEIAEEIRLEKGTDSWIYENAKLWDFDTEVM